MKETHPSTDDRESVIENSILCTTNLIRKYHNLFKELNKNKSYP